MANERKYAIFILTHGRANNVRTYNSLRTQGYKGDIFLIIDDEDKQADVYRENFGDKVIQFCKKDAAEFTDVADTQKERNVVVFARNVCHGIAKDLGLTHFIEVDDDYSTFDFRYAEGTKLKRKKISDLNAVFDAMFDFLDVSNALAVSPAQGGDYIAGTGGGMWIKGYKRKVMNMFFCRTDRPFQFYGRLNEDTTAYTYLGQQGKLFLTTALWELEQAVTQQSAGGLTDAYLALGTYVKSFYSIMYSPSCVKLMSMGSGVKAIRHERVHHYVDWPRCIPCIISDKYKKAASD